MRVTPPLLITDAKVVSSSVVEIPPPAYVAGASYAKDALVSVGAVGSLLTVFKSLQAANAGHDPAASPAWWQAFGTTYAVYQTTVTYTKGSRVIDPVAHLIYESQADGNVGKSLTTGTAWLEIGPTAYWAPFDRLRNTQAIAPVDIVYTLEMGVRTTTIAVIGLDAHSVEIAMTVAGAEIYKVTTKLSTRVTRSWRDYFYGEFKFRKNVQYYNLPPVRNGRITISVRKTSGMRAVGGIVVGNAIYLGETQWNPVSDHQNFSVIDRDKWGNITLDPRRSVPRVREEIWFDKALTRRIMDVRDMLNGVPAIWSALDDFEDSYFEPLFIYGPHKQFTVNLADAEHGVINLEVEET